MPRTMHSSLEAMLRPAELGRLLGEDVVEVRVADLTPKGIATSGSAFLNVALNGETSPRLFVKRIDGARDWMARVTHDDLCRSVALWQHGVLDRFPPEISSAVIACAREEQGHAILMTNVHDDLMAEGVPMTAQDNDAVLDAMAALHAAFWLDPALLDPNLGLCRPHDFIMLLPPGRLRRILQERPAGLLERILEGWEVLPDFVGADAAERVLALANAHRVLSDALGRYPWTLVHGDVRAANLAIRREGVDGEHVPHVIALDVARAARVPPALDLAMYLSFTDELRVDRADVIEGYRARLEARLGDRFAMVWWEPQLELALMANALLFLPLRAGRVNSLGEDDPSRPERLDSIQWMFECIEIGAARLRSLG